MKLKSTKGNSTLEVKSKKSITDAQFPFGQNRVKNSVSKNDSGIQAKITYKYFRPFLTPKPTGQETGLSLSYDIIKAYGGEISIISKENEDLTAGQTGTNLLFNYQLVNKLWIQKRKNC